MSDYGWIITVDHLDDGEAGVYGPRDITDDIRKRLLNGEGEKFRMFDDDGELYYSGRQIGGDGSEPLYDFGAPNAGCTYMKHRVNGEWEITVG